MADLSPTELCSVLERRYINYLMTSFPFRDAELRQSFENALTRGTLTKGPYLQATSSYKPGANLRNLFAEILGDGIDPSILEALHGDRPLYLHQEKALRKISEGRNVVVSTGTGSGKTESFLFPIVMHLLKQSSQRLLGPGIRALVLYPMNALANDQRDRLAGKPLDRKDPGGILYRLEKLRSPFSFTFGQYIGETPEDENDKTRNSKEALANRLPGELALRSEIRKTPPNILLTNFSMLEYLLLRPDDSPLFDDGNAKNWTFLVLDEAHQYRGAKATEMAMLIRRLKQRLRAGGQSGNFRCIATSASLANGDNDKDDVAQFASHLFDEPFDKDDVILGENEPVVFSTSVSLGLTDYKDMLDYLSLDSKQSCDALAKLGVDVLDKSMSKEQCIATGLLKDERAAILLKTIAAAPTQIADACEKTMSQMPDTEKTESLQSLLQLMINTRMPGNNVPMLRLRYHYFMRALEGAFINFNGGANVTTEKGESSGYTNFETAICRDCGQYYLVGSITEHGKFAEAVRGYTSDETDVGFYLILNQENVDSSETPSSSKFQLCVHCADVAILGDKPKCGHNETVVVEKQTNSETSPDRLKSCAVCNSQAPDPVREIIYGADGPQAVITTALFQNLPSQTRKILAFADSRQEAAYFAWFLEQSYRDIYARHLILKQLQAHADEGADSLSIRELAMSLRRAIKDAKILPETMGDIDVLQHAYLWIFDELLGIGQRNSLEGSGLARWTLKLPNDLVIPKQLILPPFSLSDKEAKSLVEYLLRTLVVDSALEVRTDKGVSIAFSDLALGIHSQPKACFGPPKGRKDYVSWNGPTGRRFKYLLRLVDPSLSKDEASAAVEKLLASIWEEVQEYDIVQNDDTKLLLSIEDGRRMNPAWLRVSAVTNFEGLFQCTTCSSLSTLNIRGYCPRIKCTGRLGAPNTDLLASNHYVKTYNGTFDQLMQVEEHTAQLATEIARSYQRRFKEGKINVLSCSTTFELGVDLGDLDAVFLRNVPPEAFNYDQRVGRSGRRVGQPGFAITYCKRGPHDLYHFREPSRMITGKVSAPVVSIQNPKIVSRHLAAVALSAFFRDNPLRFKSVQTFLGDMSNGRGVSDLLQFLTSNKNRLEAVLDDIFPDEPALREKLGLTDGTWIRKLAGSDSRLQLAETEVSSDYNSVIEFEAKSSAARDHNSAKWAKQRSETIAEEQLLGFLSRKTVIPKYGFPVDVVELDTQRNNKGHDASTVALSRDLGVAISEFAPGAELIANKKLWKSYGLKTVIKKEWTKKHFRKCDRHNAFQQWESSSIPPEPKCAHLMDSGTFVIPIFGFVTTKEPPKAPTGKANRLYSSRPYFNSAEGPDRGKLSYAHQDQELLEVERTRPGKLTIICEGPKGEGFHICNACGANAKPTKGKKGQEHKTPFGLKCTGQVERLALGQELETDVLRLEFKMPMQLGIDNTSFVYSLSSALVEGAAGVLEVPPSDLSSVVGFYVPVGIPQIILYDNVPGGAGLVARLETPEVLNEVLQAALDRVSGECGCAETASCYACLRSYRNQNVHQKLQRGPVFQYLSELIRRFELAGNPQLAPSRNTNQSKTNDKSMDWDLFPEKWHNFLQRLLTESPVRVEGGEDVTNDQGVVGSSIAVVHKSGLALHLLDSQDKSHAATVSALRNAGENCVVLNPDEDVSKAIEAVLKNLN